MTKGELRPLIRELEAAIFKRDADGKVEAAVRLVHANLLSAMEGVIYEADHGYRVGVIARKVAEDLVRGLTRADPVQFSLCVAAVYLLRERQPRRFISDRAFQFSLVNRCRQRQWFGVGTFWRDEDQSVRSWMRAARARHVMRMADILNLAYSRFHAHVFAAVERNRALSLLPKKALDAAFAGLASVKPRFYRKTNAAYWAKGGTIGNFPPEKQIAARRKASENRWPAKKKK